MVAGLEVAGHRLAGQLGQARGADPREHSGPAQEPGRIDRLAIHLVVHPVGVGRNHGEMLAAPSSASSRGHGVEWAAAVPCRRCRPTSPSRASEHRQVRFRTPPGATELLSSATASPPPSAPTQPFPLVDGHGDPPLHPNGEAQAARSPNGWRGETIHAIYVTKLQRTAQTAAPLADKLGLVPRVDPDLHEVHLGEWEGGLLRRKAAEQDPVYLQVQAAEDWGHIPGAESFAALTERCVRGVRRIHAAHPDQRVAVFVHGGVIGALLAHAAGSRPFAFAGADNASIQHLVVSGDDWRLRCYNDTSHLGPVHDRGRGADLNLRAAGRRRSTNGAVRRRRCGAAAAR